MSAENATNDRRCVFCDRPAIAGWLDHDGHLTAVCRGHQWIAVAACGSAQAEYVRFDKRARQAAA